MYRKPPQVLLTILCLCFIAGHLRGNHIFGGYLSMTQLDRPSGRFQIALQMYVDMAEIKANEDNELRYGQVFTKIYRKRDNAEIRYFQLVNTTVKEVIYENKACAKNLGLATREYRYEKEITLDPAEFLDEQGYYIVWERCCRNGSLTNIADPRNTGIVLYTEFPALSNQSGPVAFSTPVFPVLNGDYICVNKNFSYDFGAQDPDGDELRYSLVTPLKGFSSLLLSIIPPSPAPYPPVNWASGFSLTTIIPGAPALRIDSKTGKITLRANRQGLFGFAVQCEKIRNGRVISTVRHEFQLPVVDCLNRSLTMPMITYQGKAVQEIAICPGDSVTLETTSDPAWSFQWQLDGDNIEHGNQNRLKAGQPGTYAVVKSLVNVCANDTTSPSVQLVQRSQPGPIHIQAISNGLCMGDSLKLTAQSTESLSFEWYNQNVLVGKGISLVIKQAGLYQVRGQVTSTGCQTSTDTIRISAWSLPALGEAQNFSLCPGDSIQLRNDERSDWSYQWFRGMRFLGKQAGITVGDTGSYHLRVTDSHSCRSFSPAYHVLYGSDCIQLLAPIFIPTAFSPNGDGINDRWEIKNIHGKDPYQISIYDRWGEVIFHSVGYISAWDGTYKDQPVEAGMYTYVIQAPKAQFVYRGSITLVR